MNSFASLQTRVALPFPASTEDVYSRVFDAILDQRIDTTSRFTEESLAQMFGARRSDIRGVLTQLSHQQVIVLRSNHRPRVALLDAEQVRQTLHARRLTEITLVRLACQQHRPLALQRLGELIDRERHCTERGTSIRLSGEFHSGLAEMAGNSPLAHFLGSLVTITSLAIAQFEAPLEGDCLWQVHQRILDAVARQDAATAEALLSAHLDHVQAVLMNSAPIFSKNSVAG